MKIRVKPASKDLRVPLPGRRIVPKEGILLERTPFVQWLIDQKDLVEVEDKPKGDAAPTPAAGAIPASSPAAKEG